MAEKDKKPFFIAELTEGQGNATFKKLAEQMGTDDATEVARGICSDEWVLVRAKKWWREGDLICFEVTSHGTTGPEWAQIHSVDIGARARELLLSRDFIPTSGVTTKVAVLPGKLFKECDRITKNIQAEASRRDLIKTTINAEVACLILEKFSKEDLKEMDLDWIIVFHDSINDAVGTPSILGVNRSADGLWLVAYCGKPDGRWGRGSGFAFVVS